MRPKDRGGQVGCVVRCCREASGSLRDVLERGDVEDGCWVLACPAELGGAGQCEGEFAIADGR